MMNKKWILIDSSMNVLFINSEEFYGDLETKEYVIKHLGDVIECKGINELKRTITDYFKELKEDTNER